MTSPGKTLSKPGEIPLAYKKKVDERIIKANHVIIELALAKFDDRIQLSLRRKMYHMDEEWHAHNKPIGRDLGCGCDYCLALSRYVSAKIIEHRMRKRMDAWYYEPFSQSDDQESLRMARIVWKNQKAIKDSIKLEVGL